MTKWDAIMEYVHGECRGGPVLGPQLEVLAVTRFSTTPSGMTARLRELRDCGFLSQDSGRMGSGSKRYVAYTCSAHQWYHWTHGGPEFLKAFLRQKRQKGRVIKNTGRAVAAGVEAGGPPSPARAPAVQLMLGDAGDPPGHWQR